MPKDKSTEKKQPKSESKKGTIQEEEQGLEQRIIDLVRVMRVTAGGKKLRFRACVGVGDKRGKVGVGVAKGLDVSIAINKATNQAKKEMIKLAIKEETIPFKVREKFGAARILLKPASRGVGIIAGGAVRIVLELAGIQNVVGKILGSKNKINNARATIKALEKLKIKNYIKVSS